MSNFVSSILMIPQGFSVRTKNSTFVTMKASGHNMPGLHVTLTIALSIGREAANITKPSPVLLPRHVGMDSCVQLWK